jgi:AP-2 complex subunit alpha
VAELLGYMQVADYDIREELALKIAILAEKWAPNHAWFVPSTLT